MTTIKLKNGSGAPTAGDLVQGEPALDLTNKRLYTEDSGGTVIEVGTNPTSITTGDITATGTATFANLATSGDVTFGDNDKAIFGAGSDLQIYHDGSNSYINDTSGTGNLYLASNQLIINNAANTENMARFVENGAATLYYDSSAKIATTSTGIDVTGTALSHEVEIGDGSAGGTSEILFSDNVSARGKILYDHSSNPETLLLQTTGTTAISIDNSQNVSIPNGDLDVTGSVVSDGLTVDASTAVVQASNAGGTTSFEISNTDGVSTLYNKATLYLSATGAEANAAKIESQFTGTVATNHAQELKFYTVNTGSSPVERMKISSGGDVVVGTAAVTGGRYLDIYNTGSSATDFAITRFITQQVGSASTTSADIIKRKNGQFGFINNDTDSAAFINFTVGTSERMRINSSGNVGIGTSSPSAELEIQSATAEVALDSTGSSFSRVVHLHNGTGVWTTGTRAASDYHIYRESGSGNVVIDAGNVGIGTQSPGSTLHLSNSDPRITLTDTDAGGNFQIRNTSGVGYISTLGAHPLIFATNSAEAMRIDSSGNLMVGTTNTNPTTGTSEGIVAQAGGLLLASNSADAALGLNRISTDGPIAVFKKEGTQVGSISVTSSATAYNTSSDQRLKDNIVDAPSASDDIDAIQVRSFDWKADGSHQKYGMVAQELNTVAPDAVTEGETEEDMMSVDYSKLVPMLVKEIQSLRARVAQLEGAN